MCPRVSSLPTLPYTFQTTISTPQHHFLQITIPANQTAVSVIHTLKFPPSWMKHLSDQINQRIYEERQRRLNTLVNKWISSSATEQESSIADVPEEHKGKRDSLLKWNRVNQFNVSNAMERMHQLIDLKEMEEFHRHFKYIYFCNPQTQNHLIKIEQQMVLVYRDTLKDSKQEIDGMRIRHAEEMTRICFSDNVTPETESSSDSFNNDVATIVKSHMTQITQLEQKWNQALLNLKSQQVKQYRKFVSDLYHQVLQDVTDRDGVAPSIELVDIYKHDFRDKVWRSSSVNNNFSHKEVISSSSSSDLNITLESPTSSSGEHQQRVVNRYTTAISSYLKKQKLKPSLETNAQVKSEKKISLKSVNSEDQLVNKSREDFSFPKFLLEHDHSCVFSICIDPQYIEDFNSNIEIVPPEAIMELNIVPINEFADGLSQFSIHSELEHRSKNLGDLYRNKLNAFIIDCCLNRKDNKFLWHSTQFRKMQYHASQTQAPDLHFEDISTQLQGVYETINDIEPGDYFVTKHSNLSWIHVVMHLITTQESSHQPAQYYDRLMTGFENIFEDCYRLGVENIYIPVPLTNIPPNPQLDLSTSPQRPPHPNASGLMTVHKEAMMQLQDLLLCYKRRLNDIRTEENCPTNSLKRLTIFINPPTKGTESAFRRQVTIVVHSVFDKSVKISD